MRKTSGLVDVLRNVLAPFEKKIAAAFIFGSVARGTENIGSDVDVLLMGEIEFSEAVKALYPAQVRIRREINPKVYSKAEWKKLVNNKESFVEEVLNGPKLFIIGTLNDLK